MKQIKYNHLADIWWDLVIIIYPAHYIAYSRQPDPDEVVWYDITFIVILAVVGYYNVVSLRYSIFVTVFTSPSVNVAMTTISTAETATIVNQTLTKTIQHSLCQGILFTFIFFIRIQIGFNLCDSKNISISPFWKSSNHFLRTFDPFKTVFYFYIRCAQLLIHLCGFIRYIIKRSVKLFKVLHFNVIGRLGTHISTLKAVMSNK